MTVRAPAPASAEPPVAALPPAPPVIGRPLTDRGAVLVAAACWVGARWHPAVPPLATVALLAAVVVVRRPVLLGLAAFALAAVLAGRSLAGLSPLRAESFRGTVTLLSDPEVLPFGARADVRVGTHHVELVASGSGAGALEASLAGEQVRVSGRIRPPPPDAPWLLPRHVVARLSAATVEREGPGTAPWRAANRLRRLLGRGAQALPDPERGLFGGFVLGDDRGQPPEVVDDFRGSGLSHVLVVSGQNVAFVLLLARPLTERLTWRGRWVLTIALVGAFGVVTRFEPSVLRAAAMAGAAVSAGAVGRPMGPLRTLALAVTGLVLVDPLLVWSVGFQLSVGASLGIALWCRPIQSVLPGPRVLREAVAVTVAAQAGVAPILVPRFGGLPVVALIANPIAVPVAGLVTSWGLPAGAVAGVGGHRIAALAHLPTRLMIGWVAAVARVGASVPLGEIGPLGLAVLAAALSIRIVVVPHLGPAGRSTSGRVLAAAAWLTIAAVLVAPGWRLRSPPPVERPSAAVAVHRAGGATVVVVGPGGRDVDLLGGLRRAGVRRIDLLVADRRRLDATARLLRHRWRVSAVRGASPEHPIRLRLGGLLVVLSPGRDPVVAAGRVRP